MRLFVLLAALALAACDCGGANDCQTNCDKVPQCYVAPPACSADADCGPHSHCSNGKCLSSCLEDCNSGKVSQQCQTCLQNAIGCPDVSACGC